MMLTFSVTDAMIHKMRLFFVDLNIKSRGLITNSYILPSQQQSGNTNNSHLRNALLQGASAQQQQQQVATPPSDETALKELPAASPTPCLQGQVVCSTTTPLKTKLAVSSTLSSSHATLTALLNNGGAVVGATPTGNSTSSNIAKFRN